MTSDLVFLPNLKYIHSNFLKKKNDFLQNEKSFLYLSTPGDGVTQKQSITR